MPQPPCVAGLARLRERARRSRPSKAKRGHIIVRDRARKIARYPCVFGPTGRHEVIETADIRLVEILPIGNLWAERKHMRRRLFVVGETVTYVEQRLPDLVWRETYDVLGFAAPIDGEPYYWIRSADGAYHRVAGQSELAVIRNDARASEQQRNHAP